MAFPKHGREYDVLGVSASRIASGFHAVLRRENSGKAETSLSRISRCCHGRILTEDAQRFFRELVQREVEQRRRAYMNHEPFHEFLLPIKIRDFSDGGRALAFDAKTLLGEEGERLVAKAYGLEPTASDRIERDVIEALEFQYGVAGSGEDAEAESLAISTKTGTSFSITRSGRSSRLWSRIASAVSSAAGTLESRWIRRLLRSYPVLSTRCRSVRRGCLLIRTAAC